MTTTTICEINYTKYLQSGRSVIGEEVNAQEEEVNVNKRLWTKKQWGRAIFLSGYNLIRVSARRSKKSSADGMFNRYNSSSQCRIGLTVETAREDIDRTKEWHARKY